MTAILAAETGSLLAVDQKAGCAQELRASTVLRRASELMPINSHGHGKVQTCPNPKEDASVWLRSLSSAECVSLMASHRIAHLACAKANAPYVVPLYYAYADEQIFGFSTPGKKIEIMRVNPLVSLVVEDLLPDREWRCVVAGGRFEELPERIGHKKERDRAWALLSKHANWWEPGALKPIPSVATAPEIFFRIHITEMSGREARNDSAAT